MGSESNILFIWLVYLAASTFFYSIFWIVSNALNYKFWIYLSRGFLAAIIFTPWYVNIQGGELAPALMIMTLDLITIGAAASTRAGIPLVFSVIILEMISIGLYFFRKNEISK